MQSWVRLVQEMQTSFGTVQSFSFNINTYNIVNSENPFKICSALGVETFFLHIKWQSQITEILEKNFKCLN